MKKQNKKILLIISLILLFIGVGYALLSSTLNINGSTIINGNTWDVHFENVKIETKGNPGSLVFNPDSLSINSNNKVTSFSYAGSLNNPGDKYIISVDVVNSGTIDAMVGSYSNTVLSLEQQKYMDYSVNYVNDKDIVQGDVLKSGEKVTIVIGLSYKSDLQSEDLPTTENNFNSSFMMNYIQAN